jgi:hypothetical protein
MPMPSNSAAQADARKNILLSDHQLARASGCGR